MQERGLLTLLLALTPPRALLQLLQLEALEPLTESSADYSNEARLLHEQVQPVCAVAAVYIGTSSRAVPEYTCRMRLGLGLRGL